MRKTADRLTESSIRTALLAWLQRRLSGRDRMIEELGIEHGSARVDVALASSRLTGYEIKSDFDTLDRLARQMHAYQRVFDALTIVTTAAFVDEVEALLPASWGVIIARPSSIQRVTLVQRRQATPNKRQDTTSLAAMLWRDEAYAFLMEQCGAVVRANATRSEIYEALATSVPPDAIRDRVLETLKARNVTGSRLHRPSDKLARGERQVMVGGVPSPCHEAA